MSLGSASAGRLINGKSLPNHKGWIRRNSERQYGTPELIETLKAGVEKVREKYPNTCRLVTGDVSKKFGGPLLPHRSHRSGRDIDIGLYAKGNRELTHFEGLGNHGYDVAKNWTLVQALLETGQIEYIFLDYQIQKKLYEYVKSHLQPTDEFLNLVFQYPKGPGERRGIIRHRGGHSKHYHVRIFSPVAITAGRKYAGADPMLAKFFNPDKLAAVNYDGLQFAARFAGKTKLLAAFAYPNAIPAPPVEKIHLVSSDTETLDSVAKTYRTSVGSLCELNGVGADALLLQGMQLRVLAPAGYEPSTAPVTTAELIERFGSNLARVHSVEDGESLWSIAKEYELDIADLCQWNDLSFRTVLQPGQTILIHPKKPPLLLSRNLMLSEHVFAYIRGEEKKSDWWGERLAGSFWSRLKTFFGLLS
jgi:LysM repeat protein